ncbi:MAG: hypothetical protein PHO02_07315 [Candidatus Nanoarchaeia archaeon]|nr:hypothetical protein [Candidatus Nanoarchaeia archaeon]
MKKRTLLVLLVIGLLIFTYGCSKTEKQAAETEMNAPEEKVEAAIEDLKIADEKAEAILNGLNKGDYAMFSTDFSDGAKQSFDEAYFNKIRKFIKDNSGDYVTKSIAMSKGNSFTYDCQFSRETVLLGLVMSSDLNNVESLYFDSASMREVLASNLDLMK